MKRAEKSVPPNHDRNSINDSALGFAPVTRLIDRPGLPRLDCNLNTKRLVVPCCFYGEVNAKELREKIRVALSTLGEATGTGINADGILQTLFDKGRHTILRVLSDEEQDVLSISEILRQAISVLLEEKSNDLIRPEKFNINGVPIWMPGSESVLRDDLFTDVNVSIDTGSVSRRIVMVVSNKIYSVLKDMFTKVAESSREGIVLSRLRRMEGANGNKLAVPKSESQFPFEVIDIPVIGTGDNNKILTDFRDVQIPDVAKTIVKELGRAPILHNGLSGEEIRELSGNVVFTGYVGSACGNLYPRDARAWDYSALRWKEGATFPSQECQLKEIERMAETALRGLLSGQGMHMWYGNPGVGKTVAMDRVLNHLLAKFPWAEVQHRLIRLTGWQELFAFIGGFLNKRMSTRGISSSPLMMHAPVVFVDEIAKGGNPGLSADYDGTRLSTGCWGDDNMRRNHALYVEYAFGAKSSSDDNKEIRRVLKDLEHSDPVHLDISRLGGILGRYVDERIGQFPGTIIGTANAGSFPCGKAVMHKFPGRDWSDLD